MGTATLVERLEAILAKLHWSAEWRAEARQELGSLIERLKVEGARSRGEGK